MTDPFFDVSAAELPGSYDELTVLLDVREPEEWAQGHVDGAMHIPLGEVSERLDEVDPDAEVYVICRQGGRAFRVCQYLNRYGRDVTFVRDGMVGWQSAGRSTVAEGGGPGSVY